MQANLQISKNMKQHMIVTGDFRVLDCHSQRSLLSLQNFEKSVINNIKNLKDKV